MEKEFKTLDEQVVILQSRGICFDATNTKTYAKTVLSKNGYYNLINGYSKPFLDPSSSIQPYYKKGTTVNEIHALYQFDRELRNILFRYILEAETNLKSLISYAFSEIHGHKNYLIYSNFNTSLAESERKITSLIAEVHRQLSNSSTDPSIQHYLKNHGYVPLWVLNNVLTLGTLSKFYSLMLVPERQAVSRQFNILDRNLESILFYISKVRNFCAHGNRLYCYRSTSPLVDTKYHKSLCIPISLKGEYLYGKRDLFACFICLRIILSNRDYNHMRNEVIRAISEFSKELKVLTIDEILSEMGFPNNWKSL